MRLIITDHSKGGDMNMAKCKKGGKSKGGGKGC